MSKNDKQHLVQADIVRLTAAEGALLKPNNKLHKKHIARINELEINQRFTRSHIQDLSLFPKLNYLYLKKGVDSFETLSSISLFLDKNLPKQLEITVGDEYDTGVVPEHQNISHLFIKTSYSPNPLKLEDSRELRIYIQKNEDLDLSNWKQLKTLEIELDANDSTNKICIPGKLKTIELRLEGIHLFGKNNKSQIATINISQKIVGQKEEVSLKEEHSIFNQATLYGQIILKPKSQLLVSKLIIEENASSLYSQKELLSILKSMPQLKELKTFYNKNINYIQIIKKYPNIKNITIYVEDKKEVIYKDISSKLSELGCDCKISMYNYYK